MTVVKRKICGARAFHPVKVSNKLKFPWSPRLYLRVKHHFKHPVQTGLDLLASFYIKGKGREGKPIDPLITPNASKGTFYRSVLTLIIQLKFRIFTLSKSCYGLRKE
tara:strand:- start:356 stop:676 length:321 start_codon:yes stop_codon:yes gene_type:complete